MSPRALAAMLASVLLAAMPAAHAEESADAETTVEIPAPARLPVAPAAGAPVATFEGPVSYYGREFAGRRTSSGERFDPAALTMAHRTLPFGTWVRVTSLHNQKSVVVRVNDRGPFVASRIGDLSAAAAQALAMLHAGVIRVRLEVLDLVNLNHAR
jgi:rare lipoprotein A